MSDNNLMNILGPITPEPWIVWRWRQFKRWFRYTILRKGRWESFAFPIIKNINYQSSIQELISVQPMNEQPASIFYLDYVYGTPPMKWWEKIIHPVKWYRQRKEQRKERNGCLH